VWNYFGVAGTPAPEPVLPNAQMPGPQWFPNARLNYADQMLRLPGCRDDGVVLGRSQSPERARHKPTTGR
jgi:acetoacetyl-CoA synthetase